MDVGRTMVMELHLELGSMMGSVEADAAELEMLIQTFKNKISPKVERYLNSALSELRNALSDMSDAVFEITTS